MKKQLKALVLDQETLGKIEFPKELLALAEWQFYSTTSPEEVIEKIKDADILLTNKVILNAQNLANSPVKYIGILATGINNIDLDYCISKGITVKNAVSYSTDSVAQHTFSMLFSFLHKSYYFDNYIKQNSYAISPTFTHLNYEYSEIKGKTWGIIGLGTIGKKVADIASAFGVKVVYYSSSDEDRSSAFERLSLEKLLVQSDVVSIHAPLNDKTNRLINLEKLSKMKANAILINVGRGGIVAEDDLILALNKNLIAGACLDVFEKEPFDYQNKYKDLKEPDKLLLSPHIAWASVESRTALLKITYQNLSNWINKIES